MNKLKNDNRFLTKNINDELIKNGYRPYYLLSTSFTNDEDWLKLSTSGFMSGNYVDEYLEKGNHNNPFEFDVYTTLNKGNWWGEDRAYYRTARPLNDNRFKREFAKIVSEILIAPTELV